MINALAKSIFPDKLGLTLCHEHLTINLAKQKGDKDARLTQDKLIEDLEEIKNMGVKTIIELSNIGMGRDVKTINKISELTGINVIVSTGFYKEPFLPEIVRNKSIAQLAELMVKEITVGIDDTGIKAGVIGEIGTGKKITELEEKIIRSAALAQRETGVPLITHLTLGSLGLEQLELLKEYDLDPTKVVLSHVDLAGDIDYVLKVAETGVFLGIDTIGKTKYQSEEFRVELLNKLITRGFQNQILISLDITRNSQLSSNGGYGHIYLFEEFIPELRKKGISNKEIEHILVDNPRRLFV